jgi:hypothetical protein
MTSQKPRAPFPRKGAVIELDQEDLRSEVIIHKNLTQDVLLTTEDKMKLALIEYRDVLTARNEWLSSALLVLSLLSSLLLSDFKDVGPITAATWQSIYFIFLVLVVVRFGNVVIKMVQHRKRARIDFVISKIKADGLEPEVKEGQANGS